MFRALYRRLFYQYSKKKKYIKENKNLDILKRKKKTTKYRSLVLQNPGAQQQHRYTTIDKYQLTVNAMQY